MKTLYLLRHAKSERGLAGISDFDRPLHERGYADAHTVSKYLFQRKVKVDVIISSPAVRAISTALIFAMNLRYSVDNIRIVKKLYDTSLDDYLESISEYGKGEKLLLAGHNNTITETVMKLSLQPMEEMKTCSIAALQFNISSWNELPRSKGNLIFYLHPNALKIM
jgi:phosphohistidine phosphatase